MLCGYKTFRNITFFCADVVHSSPVFVCHGKIFTVQTEIAAREVCSRAENIQAGNDCQVGYFLRALGILYYNFILKH